MKVPYSYLNRQFIGREDIINKIRKLVKTGQFTLGPPVEEFEKRFAEFCGTKYAIGMNSGTDALIMSLMVLGIGPGDEVITVPNSFFATAAAIELVGAKIVFVDVNNKYLINSEKVEAAITSRTKAILPVHWTGNMADMLELKKIAKRHKLYLIEDAAQAVDALLLGKKAGAWGDIAAFSFHPLKNLNGWGDGGMITTDNAEWAYKLKLMRNHGMIDRDHIRFFGHNCRLHSIQAVILNRLLDDVHWISRKRRQNAKYYDKFLSQVQEVIPPPRSPNVLQVFHTYIIEAVRERDELVKFLEKKGVEAKVHYPIPLHLQEAAKHLGYKEGDFPSCESQARHILTLPIHQYLTKKQIRYVCEKIKEFFGEK